MITDALRPTALEVASGLILEKSMSAALPPATSSVRGAFDEAVLGALRRPPCVVSFSGGRDSSAVLAVAVRLARRDGLPDPIPMTFRFPHAPQSDETIWQESVIEFLGLSNWERLELTDELDSIGPVAQATLLRHGPLWPFNTHFHGLVFERAAGGTALTGVGGDELFAPQPWYGQQMVLKSRGRVPRPREVASVALSLAPVAAKTALIKRKHLRLAFPWLHPHVEQQVRHELALDMARTPLRWPAALQRMWRSRSRTVLAASLAAVAGDHGSAVVHPFLDEQVVAAAASHYGALGPGRRSTALIELFGDVIPPAALARTSKASFDGAFFARPSSDFVATWSGEGVDPSLVDADRLAAEWRNASPDPRSFLLLQSVWLGTRGARG